MSNKEWEEGTILIPSSEWTSLKRSVIDTFNAGMHQNFRLAERTYSHILEAGRTQRGFNYKDEAIAFLTRFNLNWQSMYLIEDSMFSPFKDGSLRRKPLKPKKKNFPFATNKTSSLDLGHAVVTLHNNLKQLHWRVLESDHAVEMAHTHPVAKTIFSRLKEIKWKRGSGGVILGNDEYNISSGQGYLGGGDDYLNYSFGPVGKKETEAKGLLERDYKDLTAKLKGTLKLGG